jgi:hypothetical protein
MNILMDTEYNLQYSYMLVTLQFAMLYLFLAKQHVTNSQSYVQ